MKCVGATFAGQVKPGGNRPPGFRIGTFRSVLIAGPRSRRRVPKPAGHDVCFERPDESNDRINVVWTDARPLEPIDQVTGDEVEVVLGDSKVDVGVLHVAPVIFTGSTERRREKPDLLLRLEVDIGVREETRQLRIRQYPLVEFLDDGYYRRTPTESLEETSAC